MSSANYLCDCLDHAQILINVESAGNITDSEFQEAFDVLNKFQVVDIPESGRKIHFKFHKNCFAKAGTWGSFQLHRQPLGLVIFAGCSTAIDVALLHEAYLKKKEVQGSLIFDSRCFIFGINNALLQQSKPGMLQYLSLQQWTSRDKDIKELLTSIFYVLESKRRQYTTDKSDKHLKLYLPFEQQITTPPDKKKLQGRWKKHLADISILCGAYADALTFYHQAADSLYACNDNLWMAAAIEGLCVTSSIILWPRDRNIITPVPKVKTTESKLEARLSGSSSQQKLNELIKLCLKTPEEFIARYKEAVIIYSKEKNLAIVELESCIKATKTMSIMKKYKEASEFLQNAVYINLKVPNEERVYNYSSLSDLYQSIGMFRKSAFYSRVAAMQCVSAHLTSPAWDTCCKLLQKSLSGFGVDITKDQSLPSYPHHGWPLIKIRILHELSYSAKKLNDDNKAARVMAYTLMRLYDHMTESEEQEISSFLESYSATSNILEDQIFDGINLPPINFYSLPQLKKITILPLSKQLMPQLIETSPQDGVFLFTPSSYFSSSNHSTKSATKWVIGENSWVQMTFFNPLKYSNIRLSEVRLLGRFEDSSEDPFICDPISFEMIPQSTMTKQFKLIPQHPGHFSIIGYTTKIFTITSTCLFQHLPRIDPKSLKIESIPTLPRLEVKKMKMSINRIQKNEDINLLMLAGESKTIEVSLINVSSVAATFPTSITNLITYKSSSDETFIKRSISQQSWLQVTCCDDVTTFEALQPNKEMKLRVKLETKENSEKFINERCRSSLKIKLTNHPATTWCRCLNINLQISLAASLSLNDVIVTKTKWQQWSCLMMTVENKSNHEIRLLSTSLTRDDVRDVDDDDFEDGCLVLLVLDPHETVTSSHNIRCVNRSGDDVTLMEILNQRLLLEWRSGRNEANMRSGIFNISNFDPSNSSFITNILNPPIFWDLHLSTGGHHLQVGSLCDVICHLTNISGDVIKDIEVQLEVFQDLENGMLESNMEDSLLVVGTSTSYFQQIEVGQSCDFTCCVLFLLIGQYQLRVKRVDDDVTSSDDVNGFRYFSPALTVNVDEVIKSKD